MQPTVATFSLAILGLYLLLWGAEALFPRSAASMAAFGLVTLAGIALLRPGWNLQPTRPVGYWAVLWGLLLGSAALAASVLNTFAIPTPYDPSTLTLVALLPGLLAMTGLEELLFRQVLFRWLEAGTFSGSAVVLATSVAFGGAHLGPLLTGGDVGGLFYLLQSFYMVWVGLLLGELRRTSNSWLMSWFGHINYNVTVLFLLIE